LEPRKDRPHRPRTPFLTQGEVNTFRDTLFRWYSAHKRDLPWREINDPYVIWISEIMLQQTRVEAVLPRFRRFVQEFPHPQALARAEEDAVLSLWSGLGYYARARNLRLGAALICQRHGGRFPSNKEEAARIPGVGPYTAAAVLSIAYGLPLAVVDGNVRRVLSRLFLLEQAGPGECEAAASELLDPSRPGDHNQAMMELGALVCRSGLPLCASCPVAGFCRARSENRTGEFPPRMQRSPAEHRSCVLYLLRDRREGLLLERGRWDLLPHLWLPPIRDGAEEMEGILELSDPPSGVIRHSITHHRLRLLVRSGRAQGGIRKDGGRFFQPEEMEKIGRSSILQKALRCEAAGGSGIRSGIRR
jgi:A/G-specific adenine glycosylase